MTGREAQHQRENGVLALLRWFLFAVLFALAYFHAPSVSFSTSLYSVAVLALVYNVVMTALAVLRISLPYLPAMATVLDTLFIAAVVAISGKSESPLLYFLLLPVLVASLRFHWKGGLFAACAVALFWIYLILISPAAISPFESWELVGRLLLLLCIAVFGVTLGQSEHARAAHRERDAEERFRLGSEQVQALWELTGNLTATLDYERVLDSIIDVGLIGLQEIGQLRDKHIAMVLLFADTPEERKLHVTAHRYLSEKEADHFLPGVTGLLGAAVNNVEPCVIGRPSRDPELRDLRSLRHCRSAVAIPLRAGFELFGVLVFASRRPNAYGEDQIAFLSTLCNQAAIALQNAQYYQRLQQERDRIIGEEEEVRHWLARELHDGPTQTLSALAMRLNYTEALLKKDPERAEVELRSLEEMARRATREIRTTLFKLRPLALETRGLQAALEQYAQRLLENDGQVVQIDFEAPAQQLDASVETTVFAIVEEAVNNARKYAEADKVTVRVAPYGSLLVVTVRDDGKGFDVKAVDSTYDQRGSLGLLNMRERAELLGGTLEIESRLGYGTIVTLTVPLQASS